MATKKRGELETPENETEVIEQFYDAQSLNPALEQLYAELGITGEADTTVHVAKIDADGRGNDANVWKGDPDQYDLESLAKKFGSGSYRVMVYVKLPTGQKVRKVNKTIAWLLSPDDEAKRKLAETQPQILQAAQAAQPQIDLAGAIREMGQMFQNTLLAMQQNKPAEQSPLNTLQGIKELASVLVPQHQPQNDSFEKTMRGVELFMGLQSKLTPTPPITDADGELSMPALIMTALKEFKNLRSGSPIQTAQTQLQQPAQPQQLPASVPGVPENIVTPEMQAETDEMNIVLNYQLKQANKAAAANVDPAGYADTVYTMIPDDVLQMIGNDPQWFDKLAQIAPHVAPFRDWYLKLGEQIKAFMIEDNLLTPPNSGDTLPPNANTDSGNGAKSG